MYTRFFFGLGLIIFAFLLCYLFREENKKRK